MAPDQKTAVPDLDAADTAAVTALPGQIIKAWREHDANAFSRVFTENGTMILPGVMCQGRQEIKAFMTQAFEGPYKDTQVTGSPLSMQVLSTDAVVLITQGGVLSQGEQEVPGERAVRASWVALRTAHGWRLASYQNSPRNAA